MKILFSAEKSTTSTNYNRYRLIMIQLLFKVYRLQYNTVKQLFTGCEWNSSFIQPSTKTIPLGQLFGEQFLSQVEQRAISYTTSE